jgi:hypothetical protein
MQHARILLVGALLCLSAASARAQTPSPAAPPNSSRPFEIEDNSFFVEEAFNQDPGVVQTFYGGLFLEASGWAMTFTQEWPVPGRTHQLSYSIPVNRLNGADGLGDIALNYRYQLTEEGPGRPAMAPRVTVLCPTGNAGRGLGVGAWGWQFNLPASKQVNDFYFHGNAGLTWYPRVKSADSRSASPSAAPDVTLVSPFIAGSTIYRLRPMFNLMLESVLTWQDAVTGPGKAATSTITILSPGFRTGWNVGAAQIIVGAAIPFTFSSGNTDTGIFTYFSYEAPFWKVRKP